jgi:hypothetical protein
MFAIPGIMLLLVQGYTRPQEFIQSLQSVPFLYLFFALSLFGLFVDLRLRQVKPILAPTLPWTIAWFGWAIVTIALRLPGQVPSSAVELGIPFVFYFLIAHGVQSFAAFARVAGTVLAIVLYLAAVGVHQGAAPFGCLVVDEGRSDASGVWDGRYCSDVKLDCENSDADPEAEYMCERVGLFGTSSVAGGRVRYRGSLNDPNELSLTLGVALPFAFAFFERKRSFGRGLLLIVSLGLIATCVVMTRSRGGQLVFLAVIATYFVKRYGIRGALLGAVLAVPILLLGGRGGSEAEASSDERIGCMYAAIMMFRQFPLTGVGFGQILDYHTQTAHNSYALAAAELGLPGLILWSAILYLSFKMIITTQRRYADDPAAAVARVWGKALLASLIGLAVGIFFLSFCYHIVLWVHIGLCAAYYQACRAHDPELEVALDWRDLFYVFIGDSFLIAAIWFYTSHKLK